MLPLKKSRLPLLYSCSGCSSVAQLANKIAVELDRSGVAEMSCIAGIGGKVKPLVEKAKMASSLLVIDGCKLQCSLNCFKQVGIPVNNHIVLTDFGIKKVFGMEASNDDFIVASQKVQKAFNL